MKKKILMVVLSAMLFGSSLSVHAAPQYMADGAVFDAEWYLQQNPDVAAAYSMNASAETLYQHYTMFGAKEGRMPYNVSAFFGSSPSAHAAPQYMADGAVFDAEWYLQQNPDVAAAYSMNASAETLYQHYIMFGAKEGRTPYNVSAFNPANVSPHQGTAAGVPETATQTNITPMISNNKDAQNYRWYSNYNWNWAQTVKSYLYENQFGGLTRVEYIDGQIVAEDYDNNFNLCASRNIPMELPIWGGFFAGEQYNFVVFGQENPSESDSIEVVRVVKYSKDWQRLGQASLYGANTTVPFEAGSLRCAEYGDYLYIRTCHKMYTSSDGLNHQANLTLAVRQSDMAITDSYYIVMNLSVGYVSHSFNQFVLVDQDKNIVTLDHGDAHPRAFALMRYEEAKAGGDKFSGRVKTSSLLENFFPGEYGDNCTGASVGGLAETANGYLAAFNYDGVGGHGTREIYLSFVVKEGRDLKSRRIQITTASEGMYTPILAPTGLDGGFLMWTDVKGNFYYARYGDGGAIGTVATANAALSDCQPICHNGEVVWYVTSNSDPVFYRLEPSSGAISVTAASGR